MKIRHIIAVLVAVFAASSAFAAAGDACPRSQRGQSLGVSGQGWDNVYGDTFICESAGGTNTLTTSAGLLDSSKLTGKETVVIADTNAYTVLAGNAGLTHFVPDMTADSTITLPAEAANQHYKFVYVGGAADAQDWIITTGNDTNYFVGGLVQFDPGATTTTSVVNYYSDGNSNSKIGVLTPESGTEVEIWCEDGTTWYVSGTVVSDTDTGVTFADQ